MAAAARTITRIAHALAVRLKVRWQVTAHGVQALVHRLPDVVEDEVSIFRIGVHTASSHTRTVELVRCVRLLYTEKAWQLLSRSLLTPAVDRDALAFFGE